jgi:hypothetical protein
MANTLVLIDGKAQVTVFFLNMHKVEAKSNFSVLDKNFNLDISLFDHETASNQEGFIVE